MESRACWSLAASTGACLALAAPRALAADPIAATPAPAANQAPEAANDNEKAAAAFQRAVQQHAAGDLQGARDSMLESYRLSNRAELLYNIGKIQAELGECSLALTAYRDYLEQVPEGRYRVEATQARTELEAQCASADASAALAPTTLLAAPADASGAPVVSEQPIATSTAGSQPKQDTATPSSNRASTVRWIGWSAVAAGTLAAGGAVYFTARAYDARDRFDTQVHSIRREQDIDWTIQNEQHAHQRWAKILGATGGVLVVAGTLTLLFGPKNTPPAGTRVGLQVLPGSVGASYAATF